MARGTLGKAQLIILIPRVKRFRQPGRPLCGMELTYRNPALGCVHNDRQVPLRVGCGCSQVRAVAAIFSGTLKGEIRPQAGVADSTFTSKILASPLPSNYTKLPLKSVKLVEIGLP